MHVKVIKTNRINVGDSLSLVLDQYVNNLRNKDIVVITSKIISVTQGYLVPKKNIAKKLLIEQEADLILATEMANPYDLFLTVKCGILIPSAGIDESNVDGYYVLYPHNVQRTAVWIWEYLKKKHNLEKIGVVISDSHTTIMRRGVTGIALAWCGFKPFYSYINKSDLCGNLLKVTQVNILDSLATAAVFMMGEGNEQTPIAIIQDAPKIYFLDRKPNLKEQKEVILTQEEDLYGPLLRTARWIRTIKKN